MRMIIGRIKGVGEMMMRRNRKMKAKIIIARMV